MGDTTRYAAVNTKIRVMEGQFLKDQDYINMLQKRTVPEVARYLKEKTFYSRFLEGVNVESIRRRDLEETLRRRMIGNLDKLIHYYKGNYRDFIKTFYLKYEIMDIKHLARLIFNGSKPQNYDESLSFIGKYSKLNPERLFKAASVRDLIASMSGSEFFEFVEPLLDSNRQLLFRLEMVLDLGYFSMIYKSRKKLSQEDYKILRLWEGTLADLYNLQWIYRGKKFYRLSSEELLNYTISFGEKLSFSKRKALCYAKSLEELYKLTESTGYEFLFNKGKTRDIYMERRINRYIYYLLKELERNHPLTIIQTICYIWFLEFEIRDIFSICECIRYQISQQEAKKFLIRAV